MSEAAHRRCILHCRTPVLGWGIQPASLCQRRTHSLMTFGYGSRIFKILGAASTTPASPSHSIQIGPSACFSSRRHHDFGYDPSTLLQPPAHDSKVLSAIPSGLLSDHLDDRGLLELADGIEPQPDRVLLIREWAVPLSPVPSEGTFGASKSINDALIGELSRARAAGATVQVAIDWSVA